MLKHSLVSFFAALSGVGAWSTASQHPLIADPAIGLTQQLATSDTQVPGDQPGSGNWLGWGAGVYNNRWASSDTMVDSSNAGSLSLSCQKKYNPGTSASPLITGGIAYFPTWSGLLVALDYKKCEEVWTLNVTKEILRFKPLNQLQRQFQTTMSRTTPVIDGDTLFIGTLTNALALAINKKDGSVTDRLQVNAHPMAIITQSPVFYDGKLFIGCSSLESAVPMVDPKYKFSFSGSMNAVELRNGRLRRVWTTPTIPPDLVRKNITGAAIWGSQPSIDPIRRQVFAGSGQLYDVPDSIEECQKRTRNLTAVREGLTADPCVPRRANYDSIIAFDLDTGRINWAHEFSPLDAWNLACVDGLLAPPVPGAAAACPQFPGEDADFGMAPTFVAGSASTPGGQDMLVVGQKSGAVYGLTAQAGLVLWAAMPGPGGLEGGLTWGIAVDDAALYYVNTNSMRVNYTLPGGGAVISNSAFGAMSLATGEVLWQVAAPGNMSSLVAPAVVNDVVLVGTTGSFDPASPFYPTGAGKLSVLDKRDGRLIKDQWLDAIFHGAPAAVNEYVMLGTGYGGAHTPEAGSFQVWKI